MNPHPQILVVEDEPIVAADLKVRLELLGCQVVGSVPSGEKAVALAEQRRPDLVLMDIRLEGRMDGIEAAQEIRRQWRLPVVYLTAYADDATLERAKVTEPYGYILKPFKDRELKTVIEMALYKHHAEEEITESTTSLILEGVRQLDEIRILEPKLPKRGAQLNAAEPLPGSLRDVATEEIQLFQLILHDSKLETVIDNFPGSDFEAYTCLLDLIRRGFVIVK